jgi:hypothetical protein
MLRLDGENQTFFSPSSVWSTHSSPQDSLTFTVACPGRILRNPCLPPSFSWSWYGEQIIM